MKHVRFLNNRYRNQMKFPPVFVLHLAYFVYSNSYLFVNGDGGPFHPAKYYVLPAAGTWDTDHRDIAAFSQLNLTE